MPPDRSLYATTPAKGWIPWTPLAPVLGLVFAIVTELPVDAVLQRFGLVTDRGDPIGVRGLMGFLLVSFILWGAAVVGWVLAIERRSLATIGMQRERWHAQLAGFLAGMGTIAAVVAMIALAGGYRTGAVFPAFGDRGALVAILILAPCFLIQAGVEEIVFRGWLLSAITRRRSLLLGVVLSTGLFALMHFSRGQPLLVTLNVVLFGLFACAWSVATDSIWGVVGWHAGWNWLLATGFKVPVTGIDADVPALLVTCTPTGRDVLTGGAQGPEGSVVCTVFFVVGIAYFAVRIARQRRGNRGAETLPPPCDDVAGGSPLSVGASAVSTGTAGCGIVHNAGVHFGQSTIAGADGHVDQTGNNTSSVDIRKS